MSSNDVPHRVRFGPYEVDLRTHELWKHGTRLKLSGQPFQILEVMLSRPGDLITRDELREKLWPEDTFVDFKHGLNAAVNKLREALSDSADDPKYIETLPRRGYRFIGEVERPDIAATKVEAAASAEVVEHPEFVPAIVAEEVEVPEIPGDDAVDARPPRLRRLLVSSAVVVAVLFGLLVYHGWQREAQKTAAEATGHESQVRETAYILELGLGSEAPVRHAIQTGAGRVESPQLSPDGKRLAYMSNRSGQMEIWVSNADGSDPVQLTDRGAGSPRWSPDGKLIAFDGRTGSQGAIFVAPSTGGLSRPLVLDGHENLVPSFSRDRRWVYFASDASGGFQVWKVPIEGGTPTQVTTRGGFAAQEGPDGDLYYADSRFPNPKILHVSANGGDELPLLPHVVPSDWASWTVAPTGIYFVEQVPQAGVVLNFYDFANHDVRRVASLEHAPFWLSLSPDGRSVLMEQPGW